MLDAAQACATTTILEQSSLDTKSKMIAVLLLVEGFRYFGGPGLNKGLGLLGLKVRNKRPKSTKRHPTFETASSMQ